MTSWAIRRIFAVVWVLLTSVLVDYLHAEDKPKLELIAQIPHLSWINAVAISGDGARVLSGSADNTLKLWDTTTGQQIRTFADSANVFSVAFSPNGTHILSGNSDGTVKLWEEATGRLVRSFEGHSDVVASVAFSPDGARVLSGSHDGTMRLWEASSGRVIRTISGHSNWVTSVAFSADGRQVLSGSYDRMLKLWDAASGKTLRTFTGHTDYVHAVAFSPDGVHVLSGSHDHTVRLWDSATGQPVRILKGHTESVSSVAFSPEGDRVLSGSLDNTVKLWEVATGRLVRTLEGHPHGVSSVAFSPKGTRVVSGGAGDHTFRLWDPATGQLVRSFEGSPEEVKSVAFSPDSSRILSASADTTLKLWDTASGQLVRGFEGHAEGGTSAVFSADGARALSGGWDRMVKLWDAVTGQLLRTFKGHSKGISSVAFSPDGARVLSGSWDETVKLWNAATGELLHTFEGHSEGASSVAFSPDASRVLSGSLDGTIRLWDVATGRLTRSFQVAGEEISSVAFSVDGAHILYGSGYQTVKLSDAATTRLVRTFGKFSGAVTQVVFSPDGARVLAASYDRTAKIWDTSRGQLLRTFTGHTAWVNSIASAPSGRLIATGSGDTTIKLWNPANGELLASLIATRDGEWLAITPKGFFAASPEGSKVLAIVRGLGVTSIDQVHQSLFNPDLVREALAGDPEGDVQEAGKVMNLEKVVDSGPAPEAAIITSLRDNGVSGVDLVTLQARIIDRGKGIGRIEWRVNGVTAAVAAAPIDQRPEYVFAQQLALDPGDNAVELVAYNASNLLASVPARTTIKFAGGSDMRPTLHVLAIGINAYVDRGWRSPGSAQTLAFPPLKLAASDAKAIAASMEKAGVGQYAEVRARVALDTDATLAGLEHVVEHLAAEIHPRDTFVLFAAAHGTSRNGRFYLIPQDYDGGANPIALEERAISQDRLQHWIANRIKAKKAILLLDTCESGALVGGYTRSRIDVPASEAAIGRLHEATGRPVLTAAAEGKPAFEGYEGHGVFTWALLDALRNGDRNDNGTIELSELVAHVQNQVPTISAKLNGRGRAAVASRGSTDDRQSARFGSRGADFALVRRLQ